MIESGTHRIAPFCPARDDLFHFCRLADELSQFAKAVGAADQNDFFDTTRALERRDSVGNDRLAAH